MFCIKICEKRKYEYKKDKRKIEKKKWEKIEITHKTKIYRGYLEKASMNIQIK